MISRMFSVLSSEKQVDFYLRTLPCLPRICTAFPPLCEDTISLLMQLGRVCRAHLALSTSAGSQDQLGMYQQQRRLPGPARYVPAEAPAPRTS